MRTVLCDYCGKPAALVTGKEIYPHRKDLYHLYFWQCHPCRAYTGTHINSKDYAPKGRLADATLRAYKIDAHEAFDPMWKNGKWSRGQAYKWLKSQLQMDSQPHIGFMNLEQCKKIIRVCGQ